MGRGFFDSMQLDTTVRRYDSLDDIINYMHGSAEVVGLMMARMMGLPEEALPLAAMQGRAMQYANFVRDIGEDNHLGRCYFPEEDLRNLVN